MHPNGELIREGFEAFAKGDMDTVGGLFGDDIQWHATGTSAQSLLLHGLSHRAELAA